MGHALMENRNGLIVGAVATRASGHAERLAALHMLAPHADRVGRVTLGADKGYDARISSPSCVRSTSPRTWRRTSAADDQLSTAGPPTTRATPSACASGSGSRRPSVGPRPWRVTQGPSPRAAEDRLAVHLRDGRLQPRPATQAAPISLTLELRQADLEVHSDTAAHHSADTSTLQNSQMKPMLRPRSHLFSNLLGLSVYRHYVVNSHSRQLILTFALGRVLVML